MFGYISVLPGAFSAYRYIALQNGKDGKGPLASYFKGERLHGRDSDVFTSNMCKRDPIRCSLCSRELRSGGRRGHPCRVVSCVDLAW